MARRVFQLRMTLDDVAPPVWRQVLVPAAYTLDRVHRVIQLAMGWQDCHLHSFEIEGVVYGEPDPDEGLPLLDEMDYRLDEVAGPGGRMCYVYDFGAWWEHDVAVEDVRGADPLIRYPVCVAGERACPPEDVGGPAGYAEFLAAISDPTHPRYIAMWDWIGRPYDPAEFHTDRVSTLLRRLA